MKVKLDRVEALHRMTASYNDLCVPGFVATHVHQMYADATEYHLVVPFQDRDYNESPADRTRAG